MNASNSIYDSIQEKGESTFISHFFSIVVSIFYLDTTSQCKKRWVDVYSPSPHNTKFFIIRVQHVRHSEVATSRKFIKKNGPRERHHFRWSETLPKIPKHHRNKLSSSSRSKVPSTNLYEDRTEGAPLSSSPHHHTSSSSKPLNPHTPNKLLINSISQLKGSLRQRSLQSTQSWRLSH